jgi:asparagine synthase (glutamine-hydrolysing)
MKKVDELEIIKKLQELLEEAVRKNCENEKEIGVIFSGGLDSGTLLWIAKKFSPKVIAYSVGIENSKDLEHVEKIKEKSGVEIVEIKVKRFNLGEVEKNLSKIIKAMPYGRENPLQVSCAIPVYFAAREARKDKIRKMLSGQGGDELFGGYQRYLNYLEDYKKLKKVMEKDVKNAYQDNLNRDMSICQMNHIELKFPFMDEELVNFSLKIPPELKIKEVKGEEFSCVDQIGRKKFIRKYILRKVAEKIKLPKIILNRKKKALQYGSGSWKILKKIARNEGFRGKDYVESYLKTL